VKTVSGKVVSIHWPNYLCENGCWGQPILTEILDQTDRFGAKSPIFDLFRSDSAVT